MKDFARVRRYSRYARHICTAMLAVNAAALGFVFLVWLPGSAPMGQKYVVAMMAFGMLLTVCFTWLLRKLFGNLAHGEVFSSRNVGCIRHIAYVFAGIGVWRLVSSQLHEMLVDSQLLVPLRKVTAAAFISNSLTAFAVAGTLLLASWIMGVGLGVSREADELKRDAELVV